MNNSFKQFLGILIVLSSIGCGSTNEDASVKASRSAEGYLELASPDGKNQIHFMIEDGRPKYKISRSGKEVIEPSLMGFTFKGENASLGNLELVSADTSSADDTWEQVW